RVTTEDLARGARPAHVGDRERDRRGLVVEAGDATALAQGQVRKPAGGAAAELEDLGRAILRQRLVEEPGEPRVTTRPEVRQERIAFEILGSTRVVSAVGPPAPVVCLQRRHDRALSRKAPAVDQLVLQRLRLAGGGRARSRALEPEAERSAAWCAVGERSVEQAALRMSQAEQPT